MRTALVTILTIVLLVTPQVAVAGTTLSPPVDGPVLARFDAPTRYGAGHRGVDLGAPPGTPVRAAAGGRVTFAGTVVGQRWVTVDHGDLRTSVGPLASIDVDIEVGDWVGRGVLLGTSGTVHGIEAVHWSARRGDVYVDPLAPVVLVATLVAPADSRGPEALPITAWPHARVR